MNKQLYNIMKIAAAEEYSNVKHAGKLDVAKKLLSNFINKAKESGRKAKDVVTDGKFNRKYDKVNKKLKSRYDTYEEAINNPKKGYDGVRPMHNRHNQLKKIKEQRDLNRKIIGGSALATGGVGTGLALSGDESSAWDKLDKTDALASLGIGAGTGAGTYGLARLLGAGQGSSIGLGATTGLLAGIASNPQARQAIVKYLSKLSA